MGKVGKKEIKEILNEFKDDDEFDPSDIRRSLDPDAHIFDLFDNLVGEGWVLKISKETMTGALRFLLAVENFQQWGDIEIEISKIVQAKTAEEIEQYGRVRSWGSGPYRIQLGNRNKIRGDSARVMRRAVVIDVDAHEPPGILKQSGPSIADITAASQLPAEQMAGLIHKGMEIASNKEAKSESESKNMMGVIMTQIQESNKMFLGLLTAMLQNKDSGNGGLDKLISLGLVGKPKSLTDQITELKALGIPLSGHESGNDIEKIAGTIEKIMSVANLVNGGGGGESSLWTEIIRKLPLDRIPDMLSSAAALAQAKAVPAPTGDMRTVNPQTTTINPEVQKEKEVQQLKDYLYQAVSTQDPSQFPVITDSLAAYLGGKQSVINKIKNGIVTPVILVASIEKMDNRYTGEMQIKLQQYAHSYCDYIMKQEDFSPLIAQCNSCKEEFEFSEEQFEKEKRERGGRVPCTEPNCSGELILQESKKA